MWKDIEVILQSNFNKYSITLKMLYANESMVLKTYGETAVFRLKEAKLSIYNECNTLFQSKGLNLEDMIVILKIKQIFSWKTNQTPQPNQQ